MLAQVWEGLLSLLDVDANLTGGFKSGRLGKKKNESFNLWHNCFSIYAHTKALYKCALLENLDAEGTGLVSTQRIYSFLALKSLIKGAIHGFYSVLCAEYHLPAGLLTS